jgi:hypothetical protein
MKASPGVNRSNAQRRGFHQKRFKLEPYTLGLQIPRGIYAEISLNTLIEKSPRQAGEILRICVVCPQFLHHYPN